MLRFVTRVQSNVFATTNRLFATTKPVFNNGIEVTPENFLDILEDRRLLVLECVDGFV